MRIRITAIRKASYPDLMAKYENPFEHAIMDAAPLLPLPKWLVDPLRYYQSLNVWTCYHWTGFLLFLSVPTMFWSMIPISIVAAIATFAAVQEGHYIRAKQI